MKYPRCLCLACLLVLESMAASAGELSLTNLAQLMQQAEAVIINPTNAQKELAWILGKWECSDRALHGVRDKEYDYASLKSIEVEDEYFIEYTEVMPDMVRLWVLCTWLDRRPSFQDRRHTAFKGKDFLYRFSPGGSDPFWLTREPTNNPTWFIMEHQDNGDVLLFRRVKLPASDDKTRKEEAKEQRPSPPKDAKKPKREN